MKVKELIDILKKYDPKDSIGALICDSEHVLDIKPDATKDEINRILEDFSWITTEDILHRVINT